MGLLSKIKDTRKKYVEDEKPDVFELLVVIVKRGKGQKVVELLEENKVDHSVIGFGKGIASGVLASITGMFSKEKEIIYTLVSQKSLDYVLTQLDENILSKEKYTGIAFTVPLKSIVQTSIENIERS